MIGKMRTDFKDASKSPETSKGEPQSEQRNRLSAMTFPNGRFSLHFGHCICSSREKIGQGSVEARDVSKNSTLFLLSRRELLPNWQDTR
jgi:hypothetical protein